MGIYTVGNQLPILLIDFCVEWMRLEGSWESVTNPLDRLPSDTAKAAKWLGISYQSS